MLNLSLVPKVEEKPEQSSKLLLSWLVSAVSLFSVIFVDFRSRKVSSDIAEVGSGDEARTIELFTPTDLSQPAIIRSYNSP